MIDYMWSVEMDRLSTKPGPFIGRYHEGMTLILGIKWVSCGSPSEGIEDRGGIGGAGAESVQTESRG